MAARLVLHFTLGLWVCLAGGPTGAAAEPPRPRFERVAWDAGLRRATAAAYAPGPPEPWLAIGDAVGVVCIRTKAPEPRGERRLRRGPVRDLSFAPDGALLAATAEGLFRLPGCRAEGGHHEVRLGSGGADRDVRRVVAVESLVAAATASGVFVSRSGGAFERVTAVRHRSAESLALWPGLELVLVLDGRAERARAPRTPGAALEPLRIASATTRVLDASSRSGADGGAIVQLLTDRTLWKARLEGEVMSPWRPVHWVAPPGSVLRRLFHVAGRDWVTSDRGLLVSNRASGRARLLRVVEPAGVGAIQVVVGDDEAVFAVGDRGIGRWEASTGPAVTTSAAPGEAVPKGASGDPGIAAVHRAALRHLDLGPERMRRLWRGASRRGWLPTLELRGRYGGSRDQGSDLDETFSSGEPRLFHDRDWGRARDFDVSALLRFDLGALAYEPESIDVSREAREVIELRDDVLDEVNQLYFERRRSLRRAADPALPPDEARRLRERAEELAAGLDAWTGGWFSRARHTSSPEGPQENRP